MREISISGVSLGPLSAWSSNFTFIQYLLFACIWSWRRMEHLIFRTHKMAKNKVAKYAPQLLNVDVCAFETETQTQFTPLDPHWP